MVATSRKYIGWPSRQSKIISPNSSASYLPVNLILYSRLPTLTKPPETSLLVPANLITSASCTPTSAILYGSNDILSSFSLPPNISERATPGTLSNFD